MVLVEDLSSIPLIGGSVFVLCISSHCCTRYKSDFTMYFRKLSREFYAKNKSLESAKIITFLLCGRVMFCVLSFWAHSSLHFAYCWRLLGMTSATISLPCCSSFSNIFTSRVKILTLNISDVAVQFRKIRSNFQTKRVMCDRCGTYDISTCTECLRCACIHRATSEQLTSVTWSQGIF